jgi:Fe2+ transport system protein FeoA
MAANVPRPHARRSGPEREPVCLVQLGRGESGRMASTDLTREDCELLHALGLTDQCLLRVCQAGDPCIVQVRSTRIGLSQRMAEHIRVVPTGTD